jgi:hypothetical protein
VTFRLSLLTHPEAHKQRIDVCKVYLSIPVMFADSAACKNLIAQFRCPAKTIVPKVPKRKYFQGLFPCCQDIFYGDGDVRLVTALKISNKPCIRVHPELLNSLSVKYLHNIPYYFEYKTHILHIFSR